MNDKHYVSLKIAKQLRDAKIVFTNSDMVWGRETGDVNIYNIYRKHDYEMAKAFFRQKEYWSHFPAPSLSEILDKLVDVIYVKGKSYYFQMSKCQTGGCVEKAEYLIKYISVKGKTLFSSCSHTAPNAAALMLIELEKRKIG